MLCCILGGDLIHDIRGPTKDYILSELERRKGELRTQLVWIGAQKEPGYTSRTWKWVNGMICTPFFSPSSHVCESIISTALTKCDSSVFQFV